MTARHVIAIVIAVLGTAAVGTVIVAALTRILKRPAPEPVAEEPFVPLYPPAFEPEPDVVEGHVIVEDDLGQWEPTAHQLLDAPIADAVMAELPWQTLHKPPTWSSWTDVYPVVRLADVEAARLAVTAA